MLLGSKVLLGALFFGVIALASCTTLGRQSDAKEVWVETRPFGRLRDGVPTMLYVMHGGGAVTVSVTNYGATVVSIETPDREGDMADIVLGFDEAMGYQSSANQWFGCTTGRVANRIAKGHFSLDGKEYQLEINNPPNHLHGGSRALNTRVWQADPSSGPEGARVRFTTTNPAGDSGYPGMLALVVTFTLNDRDELRIDYEARTDAATPVNLTNHSYFDLAGAGAPTILDHELEIAASRTTPTDATLIPLGTMASVEGTPLDFRKPQRIGARIALLDAAPEQGYDHNYVLDGASSSYAPVAGRPMLFACRLRHRDSGRMLEVFTTEPGLQLYSGNFLYGQIGKGGLAYERRSALCLEPQHFPDSVNQPTFPSTILRPGEVWQNSTIYRFSVH
jgi:aldose 1-epimerase